MHAVCGGGKWVYVEHGPPTFHGMMQSFLSETGVDGSRLTQRETRWQTWFARMQYCAVCVCVYNQPVGVSDKLYVI